MRIVITGASGFLAEQCLKNLVGHVAEVIGVTRRPTRGTTRVLDYRNSPPGDVLLHLAEARDRREANLLGPAYEAEAVANIKALLGKGYRRVVYASSAVVYGDQYVSACRPDDAVFATDAYTRIKLACERRVLECGTGVVARIANVYGPGMAVGNVVSAILRQVPGTGPVEVADDQPVRDFVWVGDAAEALVALTGSGACGIYNVGTGLGTSVRQLAEMALEIARQPERPVVAKDRAARHSKLVLDVSATMAALDWRPNTSLRNGLTRQMNERRDER